MRPIGAVLWGVGLLLFLYAVFLFDPSVRAYGAYVPERVVNLGRQQQQMLLAIAGAALFLAGVIVHALSHLRPGRHDVAGVRPPPPSSSGRPEPSPADAEIMAQYGIRSGDDGAQV